MSRRDYRHRESKKPKKDAKHLPTVIITPTQENVEVIKKGRTEEEEAQR